MHPSNLICSSPVIVNIFLDVQLLFLCPLIYLLILLYPLEFLQRLYITSRVSSSLCQSKVSGGRRCSKHYFFKGGNSLHTLTDFVIHYSHMIMSNMLSYEFNLYKYYYTCIYLYIIIDFKHDPYR